jgi:polyisoprenoid-binding protein YceI
MQVGFAILFTSAVRAQEYVADTDKTSIKWEGSKVVAGSHDGTLGLKSGKLSYEDGLIMAGEIVVDMNTLKNLDLEGSQNERLVNHLKSDDFFSVASFPYASLKVNGSELTDKKTLKINGDLTIKGISNPITFESAVKEDGNSLWFEGVMEIDRSLFNVRFGSGKFFENLGDRAINDIFTLDFALKLDK